MTRGTRPRHGLFGVLLGLVALVIPGCLAIAVATVQDALPAGWTRLGVPLLVQGARSVALALGVFLMVAAKGYFSFWRFGWLSYVAWGAIAVIGFMVSLTAVPELTAAQLVSPSIILPLVVLVGLPYMWSRRPDYGIGPQPNVSNL